MAGPTALATKETVGTFPLGKKVSSDHAASYDNQLGEVVLGPKNSKFRLVRLNFAAGLSAADAKRKAFRQSTTGQTWDVEPVNGQTDRVCGVSATNQEALVDNDYFWLQIAGDEVEVVLGDDGNPIAVGDYVGPDNDADRGKVRTTTVTWTAGVTLGVAITAAAADGNVAIVRTMLDLNG